MLDEKNNHQNESDPMKEQFGELKKQVLPPPALEKAVIEGMPYGKRVRTRVHVLRFTKAMAAYVVGIALFLGVLVILPHFFAEGDPVTPAGTTTSSHTDPVQTVLPPNIVYPDPPDLDILNVAPRDYESVGSPNPGTMSAEKEAEIKAAKAAQYADKYDHVTPDDVHVKFIANINEKYAVKLEVAGFSYLTAVTVETVYGLNFTSSTSNTMKIYAYGQFYSIPDAYTKGILSAREVQELYVISQYSSTSQTIREKCALRYGGDPDDYFVRFMDSSSKWCLVYLYGDSIQVQSEPTSETVNGLKFCYPDSRKMEIFAEDGEFYTLSQAFEQGILDDWILQHVIYYDHMERHALDPLPDTRKAEIESAWQTEFGKQTWQKDGANVRYYGSYSDLVVLFAEGAEAGESELMVGGFRFKHTSAFEIFVYVNGKFIDLATAYQDGLLDFNILNILAGVHHEYQESLDQ
ncbi:MAG: hypothetical protein J6R82_03685 [Clostridia bacterium]|nr:hypothetical protein [Clostridia bacterium]